MISFISKSKALSKLAEKVRARRLSMGLTQEALSARSGVALPTLRKFEQKGLISLESFIKILLITGGVEEIITALNPAEPVFNSIDEVLRSADKKTRKRGSNNGRKKQR